MVTSAAVAAVLVTLAAAHAATLEATAQTSRSAPEATGLSGLVESPNHPGWFWAASDVWGPGDDVAACEGLADTELSDCQQVERSRLWAVRLDPATHQVLEVRSFAVADPAWALDPHVAQDNDWEDIAVGPPRPGGDGPSRNLVISATGNAQGNPVLDADGTDITCDTRRLIELVEPDPTDPTATTWSPWKIYDLQNFVGLRKIRNCNVEAMTTAPDRAGNPQAYLVTKAGQKILSRSLEARTGRDPDEPYVPAGTGTPYDPAVAFVGKVKDAATLKFTAADSDGSHVALLVPNVSGQPCRLLTWDVGDADLAATLTTTAPLVSSFPCSKAEGLAFDTGSASSGGSTPDLVALADSGSKQVLKYWSLAWTPES